MSELIARFPRLALTALAILCLIPGTWLLPLMDRDEPRFSRATVEMNERGSWGVPFFNGKYRFDKPPLTYWSMEPGLALLGKTEMAVRLHSVVSSWLIALILFEIAVLLGATNLRGFVAGAAWLTCLQVMQHGRLAVADVLLVLWVAAAMLCLLKIGVRAGSQRLQFDRWFWGLVGSLALGFLAKGPLAFLIPGLALAVGGLALWKNKRSVRPLSGIALHFGVAIIPALALVALWGIPALLETKGAYFNIGIGKHVVERGTVAFNKRTSLPGLYYLLVMIPFLLPWTSAMPRALRDTWRALDWQRALMLGWFAAPFAIFSFYATQLPHYILPGYPALMVLIALLPAKTSNPLKWTGKVWCGIAAGVPWVCGIVAFAIGLIGLNRVGDHALPTVAVGLGVMFLLLGTASLQISRGRQLLGIFLATASCVVLWPTFQAARNAHLTVRLHAAVGEPEPGPLNAHGFAEPSLVWYFQRPWNFLTTDDDAALTVVCTRRWRLDGPCLRALINREALTPVDDRTVEALKKLPSDAGAPEFVQGWNPGTNSWLELAFVRKRKN
jgi:4-amino-4-deoxy-L-arabinose transferase-like glycosyltransferase